MRIPFIDLKLQYENLKESIDSAIKKVIEDSSFIGGKYVTDFENEFAKKYGVILYPLLMELTRYMLLCGC